MRLIARDLKEKGEAHRVVSIGDRKSCRPMKKTSRGRNERLEKDHWSNSRRSEELVIVIERLCGLADCSSEKRLVIARRFSIASEPFRKVMQDVCDILVQRTCLACYHSKTEALRWCLCETRSSLSGSRKWDDPGLCGHEIVITHLGEV